MKGKLVLYNSIERKKVPFEPISPPHVGLYVCGPTVYGDAHLGHSRPYITFDVLFRYLRNLDYKVRYVRNITDVGHLENDADQGEDKIAKKARLDKIEPMEVVQHYTYRFHKNMEALNNLPPSIEPSASGHIIEQIAMVQEILNNGFAYVKNGSVYFDVVKYNKSHKYGKLSGRILEELESSQAREEEGRKLDGQDEKQNPADFAIWKKASDEHIMRWPSPWSDGFPGWHLECSVMSTLYLGEVFDIHGGGMDLLFPHHECEIAQSVASKSIEPVKYWLHNNMITINGQKMGKSLGNFITLDDFFSGENEVLEKAYGPMTIRFFILQAHYRGTLDFSNEALKAAEKGLKRLMDGVLMLDKLKPSEKSSIDVGDIQQGFYNSMNNDLSTPEALAVLFDGVKRIQSVNSGKESICSNDLGKLKMFMHTAVFEILGLLPEEGNSQSTSDISSELMSLIIKIRNEARGEKNFALSDLIRDHLSVLNISLKDSKEGTSWSYES